MRTAKDFQGIVTALVIIAILAVVIYYIYQAVRSSI